MVSTTYTSNGDSLGLYLVWNWSTSFKARHKDILDSRYLNAIDLARHKADSKASYEQYFTILRQKMDQYNIQPHNCYNMDEKGFLIGHLRRSKGSSLRL
jgi:hypothetical protein